MKMYKRYTAMLLAVLTVLTGFVSCRGSSPDSGKDANETEQTEYTGENGYVLAVNNYGGAVCTVPLRGNSDFPTDEETGDGLNDAVFRRNSKVEELYNVDFEFPEIDEESYIQQVSASIMSGDDAYQLVGLNETQMSTHSMTTKYYRNLLDMPYLDFSQKWWPGEFMKSAIIGNNLYMAVGNIESSYYDLFTAIVFNKTMAGDYGLDDLYETVRNGEWTIDRLITYADRAVVDLNGDGIMDPKIDQYGMTIHRSYPTDAWVTAFDVKLTDRDENGTPVLLPLSDKYVDVYNKLKDFYYSDTVDYIIEKSPLDDHTFIEDRALFEGTRMFFIRSYRAMEHDFGILPYPKWDEKQERYLTYSDYGNSMAYGIPITTEGTMSANLLEALSYFGYRMILPAFYDKTLKGKTVRDEQSGEMLDIIYDNIYYEFIEIYSDYFYPSPDLLLRMALWEEDTLTHEYNQRRRIYDTLMKKLYKMLDIDY